MKTVPEFFYCTDGRTVEGPVRSEQLFEMYKAGRLTTATRIRTGAGDPWMALDEAIRCRQDLPEFALYRFKKKVVVNLIAVVLVIGFVLLMLILLAIFTASLHLLTK